MKAATCLIKQFVFFLLILQTTASVAQNSLSGKITDRKDNSGLSGATIYIPDLKIGADSKSDGSYQINGIHAGTYLVEVSYLGYASQNKEVTLNEPQSADFSLERSTIETKEVVVTGNSKATDLQHTPQPITEVTNEYLNQNSSTNVIDAIANVPGVSGITDGQSITKPVIRGLGYNRVITVNDGVEQMDQAWFDEFGIEADPDAVNRVEILKGPASLAYGSDAISGVVNLIPEDALPEGQTKGEVFMNYQTNNDLINNMIQIAGTNKGIAWSGRVDNIMAHAYQNKYDGYVLNSQFSNFNADATIGLHRDWGFTQLHGSYFDMATGIVDGTRDSVTGTLLQIVSFPDLNDGDPTYEFPTNQQFKSYTPLVINQRIRHSKIVWDNSIAAGSGRVTGIFSWQKNQRQEINDPTIPNTPDIFYSANAYTYDVRYVAPTVSGFNFSVGANGATQISQSLGTLLLIPDYNFFEIGGFAIANKIIGKLTLAGGLRYDVRSFTAKDQWVDSLQQPVPPNTPEAIHEFFGFTTNFNGISGSIGATYNFTSSTYLKANIARGWRAPNVAECAANGVHDGTVVYELGDSTIKPESSLEGDLVFGINASDFSFEADAFYNNISSFIYAKGLQSVLGGDSINNSLNAAGLGAAPVYKYAEGQAVLGGGEVMADYHPGTVPLVDIDASLSLVKGKLLNVADTMKYLPFVPPTKIIVNQTFHIEKIGKCIGNAYIKVGLLSNFEQKQIYQQFAIYSGLNTALTPFEYEASKSATKGYTLFNAGVGGNIVSKGKAICEVYIICNNLFNTPYIDYMSRFKYDPVNYTTERVGVFNMGRNVSFKLIVPLDLRN